MPAGQSDLSPNDAHECAQLMARVAGKVPERLHGVGEAAHKGVYGVDKEADFARRVGVYRGQVLRTSAGNSLTQSIKGLECLCDSY